MKPGFFVRAFAVLAGITVFLSACVAVEEGPGPIYRPPVGDGPSVCTREYAPVCGERGRDRQTFGNSCIARSEGFRVVGNGPCQRDGGSPIACTQEYDPVCARRGNDVRTFGNACTARAENYRVVSEGECRRGGDRADRRDDRRGDRDRGPQRACTREYAPVCARRGNDVRTFGNRCEAESQSYRVVRDRAC